MALAPLIGTRIRERRIALGVKQSALASAIGISPAYLNLIEHNRRNIAGKLLGDIARRLDIDQVALAEGAESSLVAGLRRAAADVPDTAAELERADEFAERFPGWAGLVQAQNRRIAHLQRVAAQLTDRMSHDPHLAASLHELLSTVTAINSTANILVEPDELSPEWRERFHRNIHEDSQRAAEASHALVSYLEGAERDDPSAGTPQEEVENWLMARKFHLPELEVAGADPSDAFETGAEALVSASGRALAMAYATRYVADAERLPLVSFQAALAQGPFDPLALAARFNVGLSTILRRYAAIPRGERASPVGLLVCDSSGTLTLRKTVTGFPVPRFGAACPLWPLFQALNQPMAPIRAVLRMQDRDRRSFTAYAIAEPLGPVTFGAAPVYEAAMLLIPNERHDATIEQPRDVGPSCRICAHNTCAARREPSILS